MSRTIKLYGASTLMNRDWNDFKALNGNIAGAREAFETACVSLFRKLYPNSHVSDVKVKVGDGGIDIFIGELGIEPIIVVQCKFFLEQFQGSQKSQIRDSFSTAINSNKFQLKEWILCIPRIIDIDENSWWFKWKHKKLKEISKGSEFIKLINGGEIIDLLKTNGLYNQVFQIEDSLKIAAIYNQLVPKTPDHSLKVDLQSVLFNNYSLKNEVFYYQREADKVFVSSLQINNIWVYGKSGIGKTVLINRNLTKNNIDYCFCDLSPVDICNSEQVLEEVICKLEEKFEQERSPHISNKVKQIAQMICVTNKKAIVIVIDELSVKDKGVLKNIASDLMKLVVHYNNSSPESCLKFVVSTIADPKSLVDDQSKANEHFQFLNCDNWEMDLDRFFDLLASSLKLEVQSFKTKILETCENSPRILKALFRKIVTIEHMTNEAVDKTIALTKSEFVR